MQLISCKCLNVKIYAERIIDSIFRDLPPHKCFSDDFIEVILSSKSIDFANTCLVKQLGIERWILYRCINCSTITHAISQGNNPPNDKIVVNSSLIKDEKEINKLQSSPMYSRLYHVVLQETTSPQQRVGSDEVEMKGVVGCLLKSFEEYVAKQQHEMAERVKRFEKEQKESYVALLSQLNKEKDTLLSVVRSNEHNNMVAMESSEVWVSCQQQHQQRCAKDLENIELRNKELAQNDGYSADGSFIDVSDNENRPADWGVNKSDGDSDSIKIGADNDDAGSKGGDVISGVAVGFDSLSLNSAMKQQPRDLFTAVPAATAAKQTTTKNGDPLENLPDDFMFDQVDERNDDDDDDKDNDDDDDDDEGDEEENDEISDMSALPSFGKNVSNIKDSLTGRNDGDDGDFSIYSASVPISVPHNSKLVSFDKFDKNPPKDPDAMGASIMEMAKSCRQSDSVELFGDLPTTIMQMQRFEVLPRVKEVHGMSMDW